MDLRALWRERSEYESQIKRQELESTSAAQGILQFAALCRAFEPMVEQSEPFFRQQRIQDMEAFQSLFWKAALAERRAKRGSTS